MIRNLPRVCVAVTLLAVPTVARAQAEVARSELIAVGALKQPGIVAAKVADKSVDVAEVNRLVKMSLRGRPASKAAIPGLEAQALEQVINRKLVQIFLDDRK